MRPIEYDVDSIALPEGWKEKAASLHQQLIEAEDAVARAKILADNPIWSEIKAELRKIFHGKCWYTESPQDGTDVDVDHFRPKSRVAERCATEDRHPGYWWLAYNPANYRYSCIVANRLRRDVDTNIVGGKADRFPVEDETTRAMAPEGDHEAEKALLIDPCKADEAALITFKQDGEAMSRFAAEEKYKYNKAKSSIKYYNINHSDFVKARLALRDEIDRLRLEVLRYFPRLENGDADHQRAYSQAIMRMRKLRKDTAPYSAFCVAITDRFREEQELSGIFI